MIKSSEGKATFNCRCTISVSSNVQSASAHMTERKKSIAMLKVFSWLLSILSSDAVSGFENNLVSFIDFLCLCVTLIPTLITYTDKCNHGLDNVLGQ